MKKYVIFAISFILLFTLFQYLSGLFLTFTYTPNIEDAWNSSVNLSQEVVLKGNQRTLLLPLIIAFLSATIAYFIPGIITKTNKTMTIF